MKISDMVKLAASLVICQLAGVIGSYFTTPAIPTWYRALNKPFFTPPDWLFGPVWIGLYLLMGISLFLVLRRTTHPQFKAAVIIFFVQLTLNALWSIAFFGLRSPLLGLVDIVLLWVAIVLTILRFWDISKTAGALLVPYLLWVSFALLLNMSLWILNR